MVIDLVVALLAALVLATLTSGLIAGYRAAQQGIPLAQLGQLGQERILHLIGPGGLFVVLLVQNAVLAFVPIIRVAVLRHEPLAEIGFNFRRPLQLILLGIGLGVIILIGNALLGLFFAWLGVRQNQAAQYPLFAGDYSGQALFLASAALLAPIGEEIMFRGYVFNAIRQTYVDRRWGVPLAYLISALLFSIAHSLAATQGIIALLVPTFLMGLVLAWGMHRSGSILPCIIAHGINNGVALLALLTCINNPGMTGCPAL
jgi:membrane protease YdiL (CAAX protease family)